MIAKAVLGSFVSSLLLVLVPLAAMAGVVVLGILVAVAWMSVVHGLLARLDGRDGITERFPIAERALRVARDEGRGEP